MRAKEQMQKIMTALKLTVNEKKTRIARVPEESFDFLGYTIGRCYSVRTGRAFIGTRPSRKSTRAICAEIGAMTRSHSYRKPAAAVVGEINRKLQGWGNYFYLGAVSRAYRAVDNHARHRLRQWLNGKLVRKPDAGKPHVRFDERGVETESTASSSGTSNRKGGSPLRLRLNFTAPLLGSTNPRMPSGLHQFSALAVSRSLSVALRLRPALGSLRSSEN